MTKLQEFQSQLAEVDRRIAEDEQLREDILFRIDELESN